MEHHLFLTEVRDLHVIHPCSKLKQGGAESLGVVPGRIDPEVEVLGEARFGVKHDRVASDDKEPNLVLTQSG